MLPALTWRKGFSEAYCSTGNKRGKGHVVDEERF